MVLTRDSHADEIDGQTAKDKRYDVEDVLAQDQQHDCDDALKASATLQSVLAHAGWETIERHGQFWWMSMSMSMVMK